MRTTIKLDDDVLAAVTEIRKKTELGISEVVNQLIRQGLSTKGKQPPFVQRTHPLGLRLDVRDVADALDILEGSGRR